MDVSQFETELWQNEEAMKAWCPSSGENVGRLIEVPGSDEWTIECPTCSTRWAGGSTVLVDHERYR